MKKYKLNARQIKSKEKLITTNYIKKIEQIVNDHIQKSGLLDEIDKSVMDAMLYGTAMIRTYEENGQIKQEVMPI